MGVSFKISKIGTRYKPKPIISELTQFNQATDSSLESSKIPCISDINGNDEDAAGLTGSSMSSGREFSSGEDEVSFILNLYSDGYSIVKASEIDNGHHAAFQDGLKVLHPYDRISEGLFAAIECGRLPGGIVDDIPCKFVDGAVMCEVRDFRKCIPQLGSSSHNQSASISKVCLKMSLENVVKDIPLMADDSWTYGDLMEVESRILNALQPKLCLDPVPRLDKLCRNSVSSKINLGLTGTRKRRLRQMPEVTVTSINQPHGKKICIDRAPESSSYGDVMSQHGQENVFVQGTDNQRTAHNLSQGPVLPPGQSPAGQHIPVSYADNMNSSINAKVVSQEGQSSQYANLNKRATLASGGPDGIPHQQVAFLKKFQGSDMQWRNQMLQQQQNVIGLQYGNPGLKQEKLEPSTMETEVDHTDPRFHQLYQNPFMRPGFQQTGWNNLGQQIEKEPRKEEQFSKRKSNQSPRLSAGGVVQSPLSVRSGDFMGAHYGAVSSGVPLGQVQRDKLGVASVPAVGRATSGTSFGNDPVHYQHQAQLAAKRRSNSHPKTQAISGVGSPASVNNMGGPMNASSPSVSTPQLTEQDMLERFAKIEMVALRHQLNRKKNRSNEQTTKPTPFSGQELLASRAVLANNDFVDDSREMSKSLVGGHMNVCKIRVVNVRSGMQGNILPLPARTRMIFSEKPNDGTVAMHYGDLNDGDYLNTEDHLPTLPNTHWADLLADQFCALVIREGYVVEEVVQPRPPRPTPPSNGQPNNSALDPQQHSDSFPGQTIDSKPAISNTSLNSTTNALSNSGMHPPGNSLQVSGVAMPARPQQTDPQQPPQQQPPHHQQNQPSLMQQVPPQFQRSPLLLPNNSLPSQLNTLGQNSNLPLGNQMDNKSSIQMLQQAPLQRRVMMGLGPSVGMGQMGSNMGLGGLRNVMGISGAKGMGPAGISVGGSMGQNPMAGLNTANAMSQHLRAGTMHSQAFVANAQRLKLMNQAMMGGSQSMPGASRQIHPGSTGLSMLSQSLNRGNMGQIQRGAMGQMGMPNLMPGMNSQMNQHQFQQLQQLRLQQQQQQQQQLQQQQPPRQEVIPQQEATSPLQGVISPQQVSSPSNMEIPQQMNQQLTPPQQQASPQQMSQRGPMTPPLSSGPMHPMSVGNPDVCPASPALSSQTLGSVGSITNSPMDMQGVNKGSSVTNT